MRPARSADLDTIVAPASAVARSAVCLLRVSGPAARQVARAIAPALPADPAPRRAALAAFCDRDGRIFDRGLVTFFPGPGSYTGEDLFEFGLHGNPLLVARFLSRAQEAGARLAAAGEFSRRAFLNGRMSLIEAESVGELIEARTEASARAALERLSGSLGDRLARVREELLLAASLWEAAIDFPEQAGAEDRPAIAAHLEAARAQLRALAEAAGRGPRVFAGLRLAIVGRPNAGKSTVFNRLVGRDRAIVTPHPGTTRDTVEEEIEIAGISIRLVDTAGLRETDDEVEAHGIARTHSEVEAADIVLLVEDASAAEGDPGLPPAADRAIKLLITNKIDLNPGRPSRGLPVSAIAPEAAEILRRAVAETVTASFTPELSLQLASARQADLVRRADLEAAKACEALAQRLAAELAVTHVEEALAALRELVGETTPEDALDRIFAAFCIGK